MIIKPNFKPVNKGFEPVEFDVYSAALAAAGWKPAKEARHA